MNSETLGLGINRQIASVDEQVINFKFLNGLIEYVEMPDRRMSKNGKMSTPAYPSWKTKSPPLILVER